MTHETTDLTGALLTVRESLQLASGRAEILGDDGCKPDYDRSLALLDQILQTDTSEFCDAVHLLSTITQEPKK